MRAIFAAGSILVLAGCVSIPPAITIASWVINGASYAVSGKSVSDHAISAVLEKDCATWRIIKGDPICVDYPVEETPVMVAGSDEPKPIEPFEETGEDLSELAPAAGRPLETPPVPTDSWIRKLAPRPATTLASVN